jgi:hypothetical protein
VPALDAGVQENLVACGGDPSAQLDVFDRRPMIAIRIEASVPDKDVTAHGSAARPKGRDRPGRLAMREVVQQVSVLREEPRLTRGIVIGPYDGRQVRGLREVPQESLNGIVMDADVRINENDNLGFCLLNG